MIELVLFLLFFSTWYGLIEIFWIEWALKRTFKREFDWKLYQNLHSFGFSICFAILTWAFKIGLLKSIAYVLSATCFYRVLQDFVYLLVLKVTKNWSWLDIMIYFSNWTEMIKIGIPFPKWYLEMVLWGIILFGLSVVL